MTIMLLSRREKCTCQTTSILFSRPKPYLVRLLPRTKKSPRTNASKSETCWHESHLSPTAKYIRNTSSGNFKNKKKRYSKG